MRSQLGAAALAAIAFYSDPSLAIQRTFVASNGIDSAPCTLQQPCRGFATAITHTDIRGEIIVLDSAGYGAVTVTKPVSIIAPPGVYAGISVFAAQDGVTVNAGGTDKVVLRGLVINGQGGNRGIVVTAGGEIHIESCVVSNMADDAIVINGGTSIYVANSTLRSNLGTGLHVAAATADVYVDDTRAANNFLHGIAMEAGSLTMNRSSVENNGSAGLDIDPAGAPAVTVAVRDSLFSGNGLPGIFAHTDAGESIHVTIEGTGSLRNNSSGFTMNSNPGGTVTFVMSHSAAIENSGNGLFATGAGTTVSVSGSTFSRNNAPGLLQNSSAIVRTHGNNAANGNGTADTAGAITNVGLF